MKKIIIHAIRDVVEKLEKARLVIANFRLFVYEIVYSILASLDYPVCFVVKGIDKLNPM